MSDRQVTLRLCGWGEILAPLSPLRGAGWRGRGVSEGPSIRLQSAPRTPTNIHVNCSLREIDEGDTFPMPSGAAKRACVSVEKQLSFWVVCCCCWGLFWVFLYAKATRWTKIQSS